MPFLWAKPLRKSLREFIQIWQKCNLDALMARQECTGPRSKFIQTSDSSYCYQHGISLNTGKFSTESYSNPRINWLEFGVQRPIITDIFSHKYINYDRFFPQHCKAAATQIHLEQLPSELFLVKPRVVQDEHPLKKEWWELLPQFWGVNNRKLLHGGKQRQPQCGCRSFAVL